MTYYIPNQFIRDHFGLGSPTFGKTMDEANKGRTEAEALAERAAMLKEDAAKKAAAKRAAKRLAGEPEELWVNAFWDWKSARMEMFTHETEEGAFAEIIEGIRDCDYRYTMRVAKTKNRYIRDVLALDMEDDARAWARERS